MPLSSNHEEALGKIVDDAENILHGRKMPLPADAHLHQFVLKMREIRDIARKLYVEIEGSDPWETNELTG